MPTTTTDTRRHGLRGPEHFGPPEHSPALEDIDINATAPAAASTPTTPVPAHLPQPSVDDRYRFSGIFDGFVSDSDSTLAALSHDGWSDTAANVDSASERPAYLSTAATTPYEKKKRYRLARAFRLDRITARGSTVRVYYKAILWSLLIALPVVLVGYAQNLSVSLLAQPQFQERFSSREDDFSAAWMLAVQVCCVGSSMVGGMLIGWLSSRLSVRLMLGSSLLLFLASSAINFWAPSMPWILAGTLLQGVFCGGFGTLASTYIADVCPPVISNVLTGLITCCWITGQLCSYGVLWLMVNVTGPSAYRIPIAMQWLFPIPVTIGCYYAPASPWWLARRGDTVAAMQALRRLCSPPPRPSSASAFSTTDDQLADVVSSRMEEILLIIATEEREQDMDISFRECFRKANRVRTEIAVLVNISQIIVGFAIASQLLSFLRLAGLDSRDSIKMAFCELPGRRARRH